MSNTKSNKSRFGNIQNWWRVVAWVTIFFVGVDLFVVSPFLPLIGQELSKDPVYLTSLVSVFGLVYAIACPIQGKLAGQLGIRPILIFGLITMAIANLLTAFSTTMPLLLVSRALSGLSAASISPMLYLLASQNSLPEKRATNLAVINSGLIVALTVGAPIGLLLGSFSGWRLVFFGLASLFLLLIPLNSATWQGQTSTGFASSSPVRQGKSESLVAAAAYMSCMIAWSACIYAFYTLFPTWLTDIYNLGAGAIAVHLFSFGMGATLGILVIGRLADKFGAIFIVRLCFVLMIAFMAMFYLFTPAANTPIIALMTFGLTLVSYGLFPALQASAASEFEIRRPLVFGLLSSGLYVGILLGSYFGGIIYSANGMKSIFLFSVLAASIGLITSYIVSKTVALNHLVEKEISA